MNEYWKERINDICIGKEGTKAKVKKPCIHRKPNTEDYFPHVPHDHQYNTTTWECNYCGKILYWHIGKKQWVDKES